MMKKEQMFELVLAWKQSGLTQSAFLEGKSVSRSKFSYWVKRYKQEQEGYPESSGNPFHEIQLSGYQESTGSSKVLELTTRNGAHIVVYA